MNLNTNNSPESLYIDGEKVELPLQHGTADNELLFHVQNAYDTMGQGLTFNRIIKETRVLAVSKSTLVCELEIVQRHVNDKGTMHGGCIATIVDILTATSVRLLVPENPIVSIDLSISYLAPVKLGETILMEATCLKAGSSVAFTDALFRLKSDKQKILVRGKQQLAILRDPSRIKQKLPVKTDAKTTVVEKKAMENGVKNAEMLAKKKKFDNIEDDDLEVTAKVTDTSLLDKMQQIFRTIGAQDNYYQIVKNIHVISVEPNRLILSFVLTEQHLNNAGTMHGGFTASLVDIATSRAVGIVESCRRVSLDLSVSYLLPAKLGEKIFVEARCLKIGGMMAFTEATFTRQKDGALVAKGRHNMYLLRRNIQTIKESNDVNDDANGEDNT